MDAVSTVVAVDSGDDRAAIGFVHNSWRLLEALLSPVSAVAYVFASWCLGADMGWSASFIVDAGLFSHGIVWLGIGLALSSRGHVLKYVRQPDPSIAHHSGSVAMLREYSDENSALDEGPAADSRPGRFRKPIETQRIGRKELWTHECLIQGAAEKGLNLK